MMIHPFLFHYRLLSLLSQGDHTPRFNLLGHFYPGSGVFGQSRTDLIYPGCGVLGQNRTNLIFSIVHLRFQHNN